MFSWSSGGKRRPSSSSYPASRVAQPVSGSIRPPAYSRQEHLDSYLNDATLKPSTRKVSSDDTTYDTVFQTTAGNALILRVRVPYEMPSVMRSHHNNPTTTCGRAPVMTLVGVRASHSWIDSRMCVVGYGPIQNDESWQSSGFLLGKAVNEVVRKLQLEPPQIFEISDPGLQRIQQTLSTTNHSNGGSRKTPPRRKTNMQQPDAPPDYDSLNIPEIHLPDIPSQFRELDHMDRDQLQSVLEDELEFLTLVHRLDVYKNIQQRSNTVMEENVDAARANLAKEETYDTLYGQVVNLKSEFIQKVKAFERVQKLQNEKCAPPNVSQVLKELTRAKKEALEESERAAAEWVDDGTDIDAFVDRFLELRTVHHERAAKVERLQQANYK